MSTTNPSHAPVSAQATDASRRLTTETKAAFKTTELIVFVLASSAS